MYCENCGKKIDTDSNYCEHCGIKLVKESTTKKENKILLIIGLLIIFGAIFIWELKYFNSPNNAINSYLKNWTNQNYDIIKETLKLEESKFTTNEMFQKVFQNKEEFSIKEFHVEECKYNKSKKSATCNISYKTAKNGLSYQKTYNLTREDQNRLLIFANWKIENESFKTINNWILYIPADATAKLENIDLAEYRTPEKDKQGFDAYQIPQIFEGTYHLSLKMNTGMNLEKAINITKKEYTYQFNIQDVSLEFQESVKLLGTNLIETIYNGIANKKNIEELETTYDLTPITETYKTLQKELEKASLTSLKVKEMKVSGIDMSDDGKVFITYQMNYEYDIKYTKNEKELTHHGESNDTFYVTVKNIELKEIEKLDSLVTYFSKKY